MGYPTDNPIDGRSGEVAAGRVAMPDEPACAPRQLSADQDWNARADWIDAEDGTIVAMKPPADLPNSVAMWPARRPMIAAAPTMLAALRLALPELREDLESLVECNTPGAREWSAHLPLPADLDLEVLAVATDKRRALDAVLAAIAAAEGR
jgi:hypothetical protein